MPARQGSFEVRMQGKLVAAGLANGLIRLVVEDPSDHMAASSGVSKVLEVVPSERSIEGEYRRVGTVWLANGDALHVLEPI